MGNSLLKQKKDLVRQYKEQIGLIKNRYNQCRKANILLVGPNECGKTAIFRQLLGLNKEQAADSSDQVHYSTDTEYQKNNVFLQYMPTQEVTMGFQVINSRDNDKNPLSIRVTDTPGNIQDEDNIVASSFLFRDADIVLLCFDSIEGIDEKDIVQWTNFVNSQLDLYNRSYQDIRDEIQNMTAAAAKQSGTVVAGEDSQNFMMYNSVQREEEIKERKRKKVKLIHCFTKRDLIRMEELKRRDPVLLDLAYNDVIFESMFVSAKSDMNIKNIKEYAIDFIEGTLEDNPRAHELKVEFKTDMPDINEKDAIKDH